MSVFIPGLNMVNKNLLSKDGMIKTTISSQSRSYTTQVDSVVGLAASSNSEA